MNVKKKKHCLSNKESNTLQELMHFFYTCLTTKSPASKFQINLKGDLNAQNNPCQTCDIPWVTVHHICHKHRLKCISVELQYMTVYQYLNIKGGWQITMM